MDNDKKIPFLHTSRDRPAWDWWSEDPIELIIVTTILILFFALPRAGCGISATPDVETPQAAPASVVDK